MNYSEINIFDVIEGKDAAWRDVYTCFWQKLVYYVLKTNPEMVQLDAEEVVQMAILKIYTYRHKLTSGKHLNNMLYLAIRHVSYQNNRNELSLKKRELEFSNLFEKEFDPLNDGLDYNRVLSEVLSYISTLKPKYMEIIREKYANLGKKVPAHSNKFYIDSSRLRVKLNRKFNIT